MKPVKIFACCLLFLLIQGVILMSFLKSRETTELKCASTFTRNAWEDYNFFFKGNFLVDLRRNGDGELTIRAYTDGKNPLQIVRTYTFRYVMDRNGQFYTRLIKEIRGASDNVDDAFYRKYFFDLNFDSGGQIQMRRFNNTVLFMTQDLLISACSPLD